MTLCADSNAVGDETTQDLPPAVKAKPDVNTAGLFIFGVPLRGKEGESGGYGCFEDTEAVWLGCCQLNV